jgi:hypothetical protein
MSHAPSLPERWGGTNMSGTGAFLLGASPWPTSAHPASRWDNLRRTVKGSDMPMSQILPNRREALTQKVNINTKAADRTRQDIRPGFMSMRHPFMGPSGSTARHSDRSPSPRCDPPS